MGRMSNNMMQIMAALVLSGAMTAAAVADDQDAALEEVRAAVGKKFPRIEPQHVNRSPVSNWYTIQKGSIVAYISDDGRYLLQGDLIDLDTEVNLSESARDDARRELMQSISDDDAIVFAPEEVKYRVTVFTDVECTFCRRLHSQIKDYMAHGIEVRYLLYPRNGPASRSWNTSEQVWCSSDRNNALTQAKLDRKFDTSECDASIVKRDYELGQEVGLSGTPAIVFDDGTLVGGYLPPDQLSAMLEEHASN